MIVECFTRLATGEEGSGCGAVDRTVASDTRGPGFESNLGQFIRQAVQKINKKRPIMDNV